MNETVVHTNKGAVEGFGDGGLLKWFGIPFAKPPVGELRFRRAKECDAWDGVRPCRAFGAAPIQFGGSSDGSPPASSVPASEDCLYLNVWAPEDADHCPVFVYIYGGSFSTGEASLPDFDLSSFAQDGVVGVSFNYRLGPLGFYDFSALDSRYETNCGVSDMIAAVTWVHDNIAAFGGDPDRVTICGQSAGGAGVFALMSAPSVRGCFHQAVTMSGKASGITSPFASEINNKLFFDAIGLEPAYAGALQNIYLGMLRRGGNAVSDHYNVLNPGISISGPVIDDLVPDYPWNMLSGGNAKGVRCLMGTCKNDGGLAYAYNHTVQNWGEVKTCLELNDLRSTYGEFRNSYAGMSEEQAMMAWTTDRDYWVGTVRCALAQSTHNDVYVYRYDFVPKAGKFADLGATHCMDIGPALDTYSGFCGLFYDKVPMKEQKELHRCLHGAFVNFVKTGNPGGTTGAAWEPFTPEERIEMGIDLTCRALADPNRARYDLWEPIHLYEPDYGRA